MFSDSIISFRNVSVATTSIMPWRVLNQQRSPAFSRPEKRFVLLRDRRMRPR
jgi:hypothetical protein